MGKIKLKGEFGTIRTYEYDALYIDKREVDLGWIEIDTDVLVLTKNNQEEIFVLSDENLKFVKEQLKGEK